VIVDFTGLTIDSFLTGTSPQSRGNLTGPMEFRNSRNWQTDPAQDLDRSLRITSCAAETSNPNRNCNAASWMGCPFCMHELLAETVHGGTMSRPTC
jgi:hypothetical protein